MKKVLVLLIIVLVFTGCSNKCEKEEIECEKIEYITIPIAASTIQPRTKITEEMIDYIKVPSSSINNEIVIKQDSIIGLYTDINALIPRGSMFYEEVLVDVNELPDSAFVEVPEGQRPYALSVALATTYGNSILPGNFIDIYIKLVDDNGQIMVGRLLSDVKILAVKDSNGNNVFENNNENRVPATLIFAVPEDIYILLKKAEYLKSTGVDLFLVPQGGSISLENVITVDSQYLVNYINNKTINY